MAALSQPAESEFLSVDNLNLATQKGVIEYIKADFSELNHTRLISPRSGLFKEGDHVQEIS
jgi:hypothetical protein